MYCYEHVSLCTYRQQPSSYRPVRNLVKKLLPLSPICVTGDVFPRTQDGMKVRCLSRSRNICLYLGVHSYLLQLCVWSLYDLQMPRTGNNVLCKPTVDICRSCMTGQCGCVRLSATAHSVKLVNWCFERGQPLGIKSGLKELVSWCFKPSQPQRITSGLKVEGDFNKEICS